MGQPSPRQPAAGGPGIPVSTRCHRSRREPRTAERVGSVAFQTLSISCGCLQSCHQATLCAKWLQGRVRLFGTPGTVAPPGSSVLGILRSRTLEWVAWLPPGDFPDPEIEHASLVSPSLAGGFFITSIAREAPHSFEKGFCCCYLFSSSRILLEYNIHKVTADVSAQWIWANVHIPTVITQIKAKSISITPESSLFPFQSTPHLRDRLFRCLEMTFSTFSMESRLYLFASGFFNCSTSCCWGFFVTVRASDLRFFVTGEGSCGVCVNKPHAVCCPFSCWRAFGLSPFAVCWRISRRHVPLRSGGRFLLLHWLHLFINSSLPSLKWITDLFKVYFLALVMKQIKSLKLAST